MKLNNWSVVKSPIGISIKHTEGKRFSSLEICISMIDGKVHINTYQDGVDEPITQAIHNTTPIPYFKTEKKQPKNTKAYRDLVRKATNAYLFNVRKLQNAEFVPPVSLSKVTKKKGESK